MPFMPAVQPPAEISADALWCVFHKNTLCVLRDAAQVRLPTAAQVDGLNLPVIREQYLGTLDDVPCYCAEIEQLPSNLPDNVKFDGLRALFERLPSDIFWMAGRASQTMHWNRTHQFCGMCGHATEHAENERAKRCPKCGHTSYPRISPAIIVAVVKDEGQLLLAHAKHFPEGLYSVIAGFVEAGETFEEAVCREVKEEVNIDVADIRYFGNQPWPFPDSLMVAFTAKYAGGDIQPDNVEIMDAGWYSADALPTIPGKISVARKLIDWFTANHPA